jgi:hypothetical protein
LNLTVLLGSLAILILAVAFWPISWFIRRRYGVATDPAEVRQLRLWGRVAAAIALLYAIAWIALLMPVLKVQLWVYSSANDGLVRTLQVAGLLLIVAAAVGVWSLWRLSTLQRSWGSWIRNGALAVALLGIVWIGFVGKLISFNLNY